MSGAAPGDTCRRQSLGLVALVVREPDVQPQGKVAVFADLYGNLWDLIQPAATFQ